MANRSRSGDSGATPCSLADVNGGRPFAWLPANVFNSGDPLNGTERYVLAALYATTRFQDSTAGQEASYVETPAGGWGLWLGVSERTARRSFERLIVTGRMFREDNGRRGQWELAESALVLRDESGLGLRIELAPMTQPGWTCAMRATWIALCSFARDIGSRSECFPSVARLADAAGMDRRNVQRALRRIETAGFVGIRQRRGTALFSLFPLGDAPDTGQNRRPYTGHNRRPSRPQSPPLPARIAAPTRPESPPKLESPNLNLQQEPLTGTKQLRSRRSGANAQAVENSLGGIPTTARAELVKMGLLKPGAAS